MMTELLAEIVDCFSSLAIFAKNSIIYVWLSPNYATGVYLLITSNLYFPIFLMFHCKKSYPFSVVSWRERSIWDEAKYHSHNFIWQSIQHWTKYILWESVTLNYGWRYFKLCYKLKMKLKLWLRHQSTFPDFLSFCV